MARKIWFYFLALISLTSALTLWIESSLRSRLAQTIHQEVLAFLVPTQVSYFVPTVLGVGFDGVWGYIVRLACLAMELAFAFYFAKFLADFQQRSNFVSALAAYAVISFAISFLFTFLFFGLPLRLKHGW